MTERLTSHSLGLNILTARDAELIRRINDTATPYPEAPLLQRFAAAVRSRPKKQALFDEDGRGPTFAELDRESDRLARLLRGAGLAEGGVAGLCMAPQPGALLAMIAILKAGGAYLPLDVTFPVARLGYILADARARWVLTSRESANLLAGLDLAGSGIKLIVVDGPGVGEGGLGSAEIAAQPAAGLGIERSPGSACYVIYTSGSTGSPKGVMVEDRSLLNFTGWYDGECGFSAEPDSATGVFVSFAFDSQVSTTLVPLLCGGSVLVPGAGLIGDFEGFLSALERHRLTSIMLTPSYMNMIVNALDPARFPLGHLRYVVLGAERANAETVRRWLRTHPAHRVVHRYGPTEGTVACTFLRLTAADVGGHGDALPIGQPIGNARIYVVNPRGGLCPPRVKGEICIGGVSVTRGYLDRPEQTARSFVPDPFSGDPGARLYRTGDLGSYLPAGLIAFHGRGDDQVKIRGYRVELVEVEQSVKQHPAVELAAVLASAEEVAGSRQLECFYTSSDPTLTPAELRRFLRSRVPEFMVPGRIHQLAAMPLLQHGKVDRQKLRRMADETPERPAVSGAGEEPRSELERQIAALVAETLGSASVPLHASFFDLGANSLSMARLHYLLGKELPGRVSLGQLFGNPTVARLAGLVAGPETVTAAPGRGLSRAAACREVAVIGMAGRFPGAGSLDELWANLLAARSSIGSMPAGRLALLQRGYPRPIEAERFSRAGYLEGIDLFDPLFFNLSPGEAELVDPQQRLFLEVAYEALESAGYASDEVFGSETGVFLGDAVNQYGMILPRFSGAALPGNRPAVIAGRTSYTFNLLGPALNVDTACSSSLVALHLACNSLRSGECGMALVGGSDLLIAPPLKDNPYADVGIGSKSETVRPFDAEADGTVRGEGVIALLLKPLDRALADGDHVWAVIKGSAVNQDGLSNGLTAPNPAAQERVIARAFEAAGVGADSISYLEGHGTGTRLGDPIEIAGLTAAFRRSTERRGFCPIGSVKANLGHLNSLAGLAGLVKTVLALGARTVPPATNFDRPNPYIDFAASPVFLPREPLPWMPAAGEPRRAGISSFGLSGTNCHVVVEEAPDAGSDRASAPGPAVFVLSAKSEAALARLVERYRSFLAARPDLPLADLAWVTGTGRGHFKHRLAVVAGSRAELDEAVARLAAGGPAADDTWRGQVLGVDSARTFFSLDREAPARLVFQGDRVPLADLRELHGFYPAFRGIVAEIDAAEAGALGAWLRDGGEETPARRSLGLAAVTRFWIALTGARQVITAEEETAHGIEGALAIRLDGGATALLRALARLWVEGTRVDWGRLAQGDERRHPLPTYPFERRSCWVADTSLQASLLGRLLDEPAPGPAPIAPRQEPAVAVRLTGRPAGEEYTLMERKVAESWARVLKVDEIGVEESFFELGDSILLLDLETDLLASLEVDFPVAKLEELVTIGRFAAYVEGLVSERVEAPAAEPEPAGFIRLSEAAGGADQDGDKTEAVLLCFPFAGGEASSFYPVVRHLPSSIAVHALSLPRFHPGITDLDSVVDALFNQAAELARQRPTILFGHSMGGLIAYRLAQRLESAGRAPAALVVSATSPGHFDEVEKRAMIGQVRQLADLTDQELLDRAAAAGLLRPADAAEIARSGLARKLRFDLGLTFGHVPTRHPRPAVPSYVFVGGDDPLAAVAGRWAEHLAGFSGVVTLPGGHLYLKQHPEILARELAGIAAALTRRGVALAGETL
jgi:amino acid adenylation domain-containing protein